MFDQPNGGDMKNNEKMPILPGLSKLKEEDIDLSSLILSEEYEIPTTYVDNARFNNGRFRGFRR